MTQSLITAIDDFVNRSIKNQLEQNQRLPVTFYDSQWPSACYLESTRSNDQAQWQPQHQNGTSTAAMFDRMEEALGFNIHEDVRCWYSSFWSDPLPARCEKGDLSLIFLWNEEDGERLRGNLIGHLLSKQKQKQSPTLFFACTEPDGDQFISVDNSTGEIWLEQPGKPPIMKLAASLQEFIEQLEPLPIPDQE